MSGVQIPHHPPSLPPFPDVYLLRHGETAWNRIGRLQGSLDAPLTPRGRVQAARQGAILRSTGLSGLSALTSPQRRARTTAALAGLEARLDPRLREIGLGRWEGAALAVIDPPPGLAWKFRAPDGETRAELTARARAVLADLDAPTILVTHGVTGVILRALLTGRDDLDAIADRQGCVYRLAAGRETVLA